MANSTTVNNQYKDRLFSFLFGQEENKTITDIPADYIIKPFLESHRAEVMGMMLMEYDEAETMNMFKEEGREEGREELASLICFLLQEGRIEDVKKVASDSEFQKQLLDDFNSAQR